MKNPFKYKKLISLNEFKNRLVDFGLELDMNTFCKYVDTYPQNESEYNYKLPKVFTIDFKDITGVGWGNVNGEFYKNHTTKKTQLFKDFKEFKDTHTFKINQYYYF